MKKLLLLLVIICSCNNIDPEPSDFTLEEVTVTGGPNLNIQDSVGLLIVVRGLPPTNKWGVSWEINDQQLFAQSVTGRAGRISFLKKFKPNQSGEYTFQGCVFSENMKVCRSQIFFVR